MPPPRTAAEMTTESKQDPRRAATLLLGAVVATTLVLTVLTVAGALLATPATAVGIAVGGLAALLVLAAGTAVVHAVAGLAPAASLLVALLTYTLQLVVLALVVTALGRSGLAGDTVSREGFAVGVVAATLVWLTAQVWRATRLRLPAYDLPAVGEGPHPEAGAR